MPKRKTKYFCSGELCLVLARVLLPLDYVRFAVCGYKVANLKADMSILMLGPYVSRTWRGFVGEQDRSRSRSWKLWRFTNKQVRVITILRPAKYTPK